MEQKGHETQVVAQVSRSLYTTPGFSRGCSGYTLSKVCTQCKYPHAMALVVSQWEILEVEYMEHNAG